MVDWQKVQAGMIGGRDRIVLRKVRSDDRVETESLKVTLFRGERGATCGWFIGPLLAVGGQLSLPYLPQSEETLASVAVVRAIKVAEETSGTICLVDPDDLWDGVWNA